MIKLFSGILIVAVAALTYAGVLEVKVHPEKLAEVWPKVQSLAGNTALLAQATTKITEWKRAAEMWLVKDEQRKLELALTYVHTDTAKLAEELTKSSPSVKASLPQVELLAQSLARVSNISQKIPVNSMLAIEEKTRTRAADDVKAALLLLNKTKDEQKDMSDQLGNLVNNIKDKVSKVEIPQFKQLPAVAGIKDAAK